MITCELKKLPNECNDFLSLDVKWEYLFDINSKFTAKARQRRRSRGIGTFPKIRRFVRVNTSDIEILKACPDVISCEEEQEDIPLYNPTDPQGLTYAWTKQTLTHATNTTAFDIEKGDGIVVGIIESAGAGANYTDNELGGTGNKANDWAAIQAGTHDKFVDYTTPLGISIDPYGTGHGNSTCRQAVSVMDNAVAYCGSCPNGKVMMAVGQNFDEAIQRMADLGVEVISVSYTNTYSHRTAIQYATAAGVIVVYAHGSNSHAELSVVPFESILIGGFSTGDVSDKSYGVGLTVCGRGPSGSAESWSTPATAGICGLILAQNPTWNIYDVFSALIQSCQKPAEMAGTVWHIQYGWGIPAAYAGLQLTLTAIKPLPVIDLSISRSGLGLQLDWTNLPTTNFDHFEVRRKADSLPNDETDGTLVYSGTDENYYDKLALSGNWYYGIWGVDSNGNYSPYAAVVDFYTQTNISYTAPIPTISDITATPITIILTWSAISGASGYKVYWDTDSGEPYANSQDVGNVTEYTIEDLIPSQTYYVTITAYDDEGNDSDYATEENIFTSALTQPVILSITDTATTITLNWAAVSGATGYNVFFDINSGEPYANEIDAENVLTYTITELIEHQQYFAVIQAYIGEYSSLLSDEATTQTGISSISTMSATMSRGLLSMNLPTITDIDFAGYTIKKGNENRILKSNFISNKFVDTQANIADFYEITARDLSGNASGKWTVIVNLNSLTITPKGG